MTRNHALLDRLSVWAAKTHCRRLLRRFFASLDHAARVQREILKRRIRAHRLSAFGQDHRFDDIHSIDDFRRRVPARTYAELAPYLDRVRAGETSALFRPGERVVMFALSSGSDAAPKHIPVTPTFVRDYRRGWNVFGLKALMDHPCSFMRGILQISSRMDETRAPSGVPCGSISGLLAATQKRIVRKYYVVPSAVAYIENSLDRHYAIMRLAVPRDVAFVITASPATQLKLARIADAHAERLIRDVRDGTLTLFDGPLPRRVEEAIRPSLTPDPESAKRLSSIVEREGRLLPRHYWDLGFVANWTGGTLGLYLRDFPEFFGAAPVRDIGLLATEGRITIPLDDHTPAGVLDIHAGFFEFLEPDAPADAPTRLCHELDIGREYRLVITNAAGLYRYDLGDRVRVVDYRGRAPMLEFLHRGSRVSSVAGEKLTEWQATHAFERACLEAGVKIERFLMAPQWADPPYYMLHLEDAVEEAALERLAPTLDRRLWELNMEYADKRRSGRLGAIRVNLLPADFLTRFHAERMARRSSTNEQYKPQYLYTQPGQDKDIPRAPQWVER